MTVPIYNKEKYVFIINSNFISLTSRFRKKSSSMEIYFDIIWASSDWCRDNFLLKVQIDMPTVVPGTWHCPRSVGPHNKRILWENVSSITENTRSLFDPLPPITHTFSNTPHHARKIHKRVSYLT